MENNEKKEKKGFSFEIASEVMQHIYDMNIDISEERLKNLIYSLSTGAGLGYYFYNINEEPHPKLTKYLMHTFGSFHTVLNRAVENAKKGHDKYMAILVSTNTISKVIYERDKYIYKLSEWESVCNEETFNLTLFQMALLNTGSLWEAGINCGLAKDTLIELQSSSRINMMINSIIKN